MDNNQEAIRQAIEFAGTPAGQQLLRLLQTAGGQDFEKVRQSAASGNVNQARENISALLKNPEVRRLLQQMGGSHGPNGR